VNDHDELFELVPLYALDALEADDLRRLGQHVDGCAECAAEVDRLRSAVAATVPDQPAPAPVWDRIAAAMETTEASTPGTAEPGTAATVTDIAIRRAPSRRLGWLVGSAAAVAALALGVWAVLQAVSDDDVLGPEATVAAAETAAEAPGAIVSDFVVDGEAIARVVLTTDGEGFLLPSALDPLGTDRTYQLWVVTPDELVISAGVLGGDPAPSRFTWQGDVTGFVLTREVAGGVVSSAGDVVAAAEA
jgi:hypothetical protein